jgi:hypothetical protein
LRKSNGRGGALAQLGERVLCKHEVTGSIPVGSTSFAGSASRFLRGRPFGATGSTSAFCGEAAKPAKGLEQRSGRPDKTSIRLAGSSDDEPSCPIARARRQDTDTPDGDIRQDTDTPDGDIRQDTDIVKRAIHETFLGRSRVGERRVLCLAVRGGERPQVAPGAIGHQRQSFQV